MIVISDSNIIFSCFYSPNGVLASILKEKKNRLQFIAPDFLLEEIEEHLPEILKNTKLTKKQAKALLKDFTQNITFFKLDDIPQRNIEKAQRIVESIDPDDYPFVALHLEKGHKIWTCDAKLSNGLKEKGYDICVTTKEIKTKTYKKSYKTEMLSSFFLRKISLWNDFSYTFLRKAENYLFYETPIIL